MLDAAIAFQEDANNSDKEHAYFDRLHGQKYRDKEQDKQGHVHTLSCNLATNVDHYRNVHNAISWNRFLPAGRIQAACGAVEREVSPFNCSVSRKVDDSIDGIYRALWEAAKILRLGTGIGYNFSHLRPKGDLVTKLQSEASGPLSYMHVYDASAHTIASAGHRRGAQMGILNVDHPDIEAFVDSKMVKDSFEYFNISVGISDDFMRCVRDDGQWELKFNGTVYNTISARYLWGKILRNAYASAEPGVIFLERMNKTNNLYYCEDIEATNPCSEQPLPQFGLCTLGSFNLAGYLDKDLAYQGYGFEMPLFRDDIFTMVEAYDNIFDKAIYAIPEHRTEALNKRRIGLGLTGIANGIEMLVGRASYGDKEFNSRLDEIAKMLVYTAYEASVKLAKERGPFPLFDKDKYLKGEFVQKLPEYIKQGIAEHGIRNSHLISYAPCGTISQIAGNISSGVEPVFFHEVERNVILKEGKEKIKLRDWAYREHGFKGRTLDECTVDHHMTVGEICQRWCDSSVSKTVNVPGSCTYEEYADTYMRAYELGMKGITVYRHSQEVQELRGVVIAKAETPNNTSELNTQSCASGVCER